MTRTHLNYAISIWQQSLSNVMSSIIFFWDYTVQRRHSQRMHTHPYEPRTQTLLLWASSKNRSANPRDWLTKMNSVICQAASTSTGPWRNLQNGTGHCSLQYIYTRDQIHIYSNNFMKVNRWSDLPWKKKERRSNIFRRSTWSSRRYTGAPCKNEIIYSLSRFFRISASDKVHHWIIDIWTGHASSGWMCTFQGKRGAEDMFDAATCKDRRFCQKKLSLVAASFHDLTSYHQLISVLGQYK